MSNQFNCPLEQQNEGPSSSQPRPKRPNPLLDAASIESKKLKPDFLLNSEVCHSTSGLSCNTHGAAFQVKLLMLFAHRARKKKLFPFKLATEMNAADKIDDVVFQYENPNEKDRKIWRFMQAKHILNPEVSDNMISKSELKSPKNDNFSLQKYFISFCKIKDNEIFKGDLKDFVLITNAAFKEESKEWFQELNDLESDEILGFDNIGAEKYKLKLNDTEKVMLKNIFKTKLLESVSSVKGTKAIESILSKLTRNLALVKNAQIEGLQNLTDMEKQFLDNEKKRLRELKIRILGLDDLNLIKHETAKELLKTRLPDSSKITKNSNLNKEKMGLEKKLEGYISEMSIIQVALDNEKFENYLKDFLNKFYFITNYMCESTLEQRISQEIREEFKLKGVDLLYARFEKGMFDFLKYYIRGKALFCTSDDVDQFFRYLEGQLCLQMATGLSIGQVNELKNHKIGFNKCSIPETLEKFISNGEQSKILHFSTQTVRLSAIKVLQTINNYAQFKNYIDSYLFINLQKLLDGGMETDLKYENTRQMILYVFEMINTCNLLVIECQKKENSESNNLDKLCNEISRILQNQKLSKKIVLISHDDDELLVKIRKDASLDGRIDTLSDKTSFSDYDDESKDRIRRRKVVLQNPKNPVQLKLLIETNSEWKIFDQHILSRFLDEMQISIGDRNAFSSRDYYKDYYIERKFHYQIIDEKILKEESDSLFFITGVIKEDLVKMGSVSGDILEYKKGKKYGKGIIIPSQSIQNSQDCKDIFESFGENAIWLDYCSSRFIWKGCKSNAEVPNKYLSMKEYSDDITPLNEDYFCKAEESFLQKIIIVANDSGMGKSTVLTSLARKMKMLDEIQVDVSDDRWIVRINLNDHAEELERIKKIKQEIDSEYAIKFVTEIAVPGDRIKDPIIRFQQNIFKAGLTEIENKRTKIVIMFDGFDEISPDYKTQTIRIIKTLKASQVAQIWVTTRVHEKVHLEKELETPAIILNDLSTEDQTEFYSQFWKSNLKFKKDSNGKKHDKTYEDILKYLRKIKLPKYDYAKQFKESISKILNYFPQDLDNLEGLRNAINDKLDLSEYIQELKKQWEGSLEIAGTQFTVNPLHCKMLAELIFRNKFQLPKEFGLFHMYDKFREMKFDIYYDEKNKYLKGNLAHKNSREEGEKLSNTLYKALAVQLILNAKPENDLPDLEDLRIFEEGKQEEDEQEEDEQEEDEQEEDEQEEDEQEEDEQDADEQEEDEQDEDEKQEKKKQEAVSRGFLRLNNDRLEFIHRSFAEYFLSIYLIDNLNNEQVQQLLVSEILGKDGFQLVLKFFNDQLFDRKKKKRTEKIKLEESTKTLLEENTQGKDEYDFILYKIAKGNHIGIIKFLFNAIPKDDYLYETLLTTLFDVKYLMFFFAKDVTKYTIKELLEASSKLDPEIIKIEILHSHAERNNLLSFTILRSNFDSSYNNVEVIIKFIRKNKKKFGNIFLEQFVTSYPVEKALKCVLRPGEDFEAVQQIINSFRDHLPEDIFHKFQAFLVESELIDLFQFDEECTEWFVKWFEDNPHVLNSLLIKYVLNTLEANFIQHNATDFVEIIFQCINASDTSKEISNEVKRLKEIMKKKDTSSEENTSSEEDTSSEGDTSSEEEDNLLEEDTSEQKKDINGKTNRLNEAIRAGTTDKVQEILNKNTNNVKQILLAKNEDGKTVLHVAAEYNQFEVVQMLFDSIKEQPKIVEKMALKKNVNGETPLYSATRLGHKQTVEKILDLMKDDQDALKKLLLSPIRNLRRLDGINHLLSWIKRNLGNFHLKKIILEVYAINQRSLFNFVKKYVDDSNLYQRINQFLERYFHHINDHDIFEDLAIFSVYNDARHDPKKRVDELLKIDGIKTEIRQKLGEIDSKFNEIKTIKKALDKVVCEGNIDDVRNVLPESLIVLKATLLLSNEKGKTALHLAAESDRGEIIGLLLGNVRKYPRFLKHLLLKADSFQEDTALHRAAQLGHHKAVRSLLKFLKNHKNERLSMKIVTKLNGNRKNALKVAYHRGHHKIVEAIFKFIDDYSHIEFIAQMKKIDNKQPIRKWTKKNEYAELKQRFLKRIGPWEEMKFKLFEAADQLDPLMRDDEDEDGDKDVNTSDSAILTFLKKNKEIPRLKKLLLKRNEKGKTLATVLVDNRRYDELEWITSHLKNHKKFLAKFVLDIRDYGPSISDYLSWLIKIEKIIPGIIERVFFEGHSAMIYTLIRIIEFNGFSSAKEFLKYSEKNFSEVIFEKLVLDYPYYPNGTILECIDMSKNPLSSETIDFFNFLFELLENHQNILKKLLFTSDILQNIDKKRTEHPVTHGIHRLFNTLKPKYDEIVQSLSNYNPIVLDFSSKGHKILQKHVKYFYDKGNKNDILQKLEEIRSENLEKFNQEEKKLERHRGIIRSFH